jgi:peptidoglycan-associated lipoprotein
MNVINETRRKLMQKKIPLYGVTVVLIAAFMTAGCAKQEIVRKDEGIAPATVVTRVEPPPVNQPSLPTSQIDSIGVTPADSTLPAGHNRFSRSQLQSALNKIYFNYDSAGLSEPARSTLSKNAGILQHESAAKITIEGNCDERGSTEYNLALGERRARAAQHYLVTLGIDPARLSVVSYGKEKPVVTTNDEAAWAKNRRAEFVVAQPVNIAHKSDL